MAEEIREGGEHDPNTDAGFNALLAEKVGRELSSEDLEKISGSDTSVAAGLVEEESAQTRDDKGRFAPAAPVETEGAAPEGAEQEDPVEKLAASLLEKHGGDTGAALADAVRQQKEAESLIGRHSEEVGNLRKQNEDFAAQLARLEGKYEGFTQARPDPATGGPPVTFDQLEQGFASGEENAGRATMQWVLDNRFDLMDDAVKIWARYEPFEAALFQSRFERELDKGMEQKPATAPAEDPRLQTVLLRESLNTALTEAKQGFSDSEWTAVRPFINEAMDSAPETVQNMLVSSDPALQKQGMGLVTELAKGRAIASAITKLKADDAAAAAALKQGAQVITGTQRPAAPAGKPTGEMTRDERLKIFKDELMAAETTSISEGLTYSK